MQDFDHSQCSQSSGHLQYVGDTLQMVPQNFDSALNVQSYQQNYPPRKRRRAIRKLQGDPENMQLGDLLFYNPPKTIFQLENNSKTEIDFNDNSDQNDSSSRRLLRNRSNSVVSEQSQGSINRNQSVKASPNSTTFDKNEEPEDDKVQKDEENVEKNVDLIDDSEQMLTFDEKGNIVIKNPQSLQSQSIAPEKPRANAVRSMTTYNSFRRKTRAKGNWTTDETAIFYTALEIVGTDFSLMEAAFFKDRGRTRKQLKQKFKREEKINRAYIDSILFKSLTEIDTHDDVNISTNTGKTTF